MREAVLLVGLWGCADQGGDSGKGALCTPADPGAWTRASDGPVFRAGLETDGLTDFIVADPDIRWDPVAGQYVLHYMAARGETFTGDLQMVIRRATSADALDWSISETPALSVSDDPDAWDSQNTETPSAACADDGDRVCALVYSGASGTLDGAAFANYAIGLALSDDGETYERLSADASPHGEAGLLLTAADVYPDSDAGVVADPEIAYQDGVWHLWFSSYGCSSGCTVVDAYGVAHATSTDAVHWTVDEAPTPSLLRDPDLPSTGPSQPSAAWDPDGCQWELYVTSNEAGATDAQPVVFNNTAGVYRATSADGADWTADYGALDLAWDSAAPGEAMGLLTGADVTAHDGTRVMAYVGFDDADVPGGFYLPVQSWYDAAGYAPGITALLIAVR